MSLFRSWRSLKVDQTGLRPRRNHRLVVAAVMAVLLCLLGSSCTWRSTPQPAVVVIVVENLGFGAFSCGEGGAGPSSGFQAFCDEAVRFTHAYTPSVMSQATIASILTAKYPFQHGVRHNGAQTLSAKEETVAEAALARGFKTGFFSGGPPIWRRSGLNQGFEIFDDLVPFNLKTLYRGAPEVVKLFLNWQETECQRDRFLSFLFLPDLQFIDAPTTNEFGEVRESSYQSQLAAIDEALNQLVKTLKKRKAWDTTDIFLLGLQGDAIEGRSEVRTDEIPSANLFSESTRATLMVKPARKNRDGPFNWKVDGNVSLADVGATLFDLIGAARPKPERESEASVHSLRSVLSGPQPDWPLDRKVISESAWPQWRGFEQSGVRSSLRQNAYLYLFDSPASLYNTLTDTPEAIRLPPDDLKAGSLKSEFAAFLSSVGYSAWKPPARLEVEKMELARDLWREREPSAETMLRLRRLSTRFPEDLQLRGWRATWAVRDGDWQELKSLAGFPKIIQPVWAYVASRNLGERATLPIGEPCFEFLKAAQPLANPQPAKACRMDGLNDLLAWVNESAPETTRTKAMEQFSRFYAQRALAITVAEHNLISGARWDSIPLPDEPDTVDLILSLPEFRKFKGVLKARLASDRR